MKSGIPTDKSADHIEVIPPSNFMFQSKTETIETRKA